MVLNAVEPYVSFIILSTGKPNNLVTNPTEWDPNELEGPRHSWGFFLVQGVGLVIKIALSQLDE